MKLDVNVLVLIRPAIPGYYTLMYKISVFSELLHDVLLHWALYLAIFFTVVIAMARVMPKPFSLEVTDNLESNNCVSAQVIVSTVHDY